VIRDLRQGGHLDLDEWRPQLVILTASQASALARVAGKQLDVQVTEEAGVFRLTPSSYVGSISAAGIHLSIRPKVGIHNLLMRLDIDFSTDIWKPEDTTYASENDLLAAMAAFYARTIQRTLAEGLLRSYREERDRLPALRGRIDFAEMIRQPGLPIPIPSVFSEHTADVFPNRILKQATRVLTRTAGVPVDAVRRLHRGLISFEEVADTLEDPDEVDRFTFDRLTMRYAPAMKLAAVVLRNLTLRTEAGGTTSSAFLVNMNDLYQDFLLNRLRRALAGRLSVDVEPPTALDVARKVVMNPDYLFTRDDVPAYVGDAKYKIASGPGFARSDDHYQMLAYCTALDLHEGVLIYCTSDGEQAPVDVTVRTSGHVIRTYHLPLTGSPTQVEAAIGDLANWIVQRSDALVLDSGITQNAVA
jgi:5-methylcytosine-specific restriction enzyme subunit McrC